MPDIEAKKLTYDELFNSTTMFYMNPNYEAEIEREVRRKTADISVGLRTIKDRESLKQYIIDHKDALDNLTSVAEISVERFKRMVSMIRKDRGFVFATEWGLSKIRTAMMESPAMMESIVNLIWDGKNDEKMQACIPAFYLENMAMDQTTLRKLQDENTVRQLVKRALRESTVMVLGMPCCMILKKRLNVSVPSMGLNTSTMSGYRFLTAQLALCLKAPEIRKLSWMFHIV